MSPKSRNILLSALCGLMATAALILLGICVFTENESPYMLPIALGLTVLSNGINLIRIRTAGK